MPCVPRGATYESVQVGSDFRKGASVRADEAAIGYLGLSLVPTTPERAHSRAGRLAGPPSALIVKSRGRLGPIATGLRSSHPPPKPGDLHVPLFPEPASTLWHWAQRVLNKEAPCAAVSNTAPGGADGAPWKRHQVRIP